MKKLLIFSILSAFCLSVASCAMPDKKGNKNKRHSHPHHRRYHSELTIDQ